MEKEKKKTSGIKDILGVILVVVLCLISIVYAAYRLVYLPIVCTETTTATITKVETKRVRDDNSTKIEYEPTLTYQVDGVEYRGKGNRSRSSFKYEVGMEVEVRYNPNKPSQFYHKLSSKEMLLSLIPFIAIVAYSAIRRRVKSAREKS